MGLTAKKVYAILNGKIKKISGDVSSLGTPLFYAGSVLTADLLPLSPDAGAVYNIEKASIYGAAGTNVAWNGVIWDALGPTVDLSLLLTREQASELYLTKNQGVENSGKVAGIDSSGNIVPMFPQGFEYDSNTRHLRFGHDPKMILGAGIQLDNTLTKSGQAADAKVTGDRFKKNSEEVSTLKEDIVNIGEIYHNYFNKEDVYELSTTTDSLKTNVEIGNKEKAFVIWFNFIPSRFDLYDDTDTLWGKFTTFKEDNGLYYLEISGKETTNKTLKSFALRWLKTSMENIDNAMVMIDCRIPNIFVPYGKHFIFNKKNVDILYSSDIAYKQQQYSVYFGNASGFESVEDPDTDNGKYNAGFGVNAMKDNTTGNHNTAFGFSALQNNTTGNNNTAVGEDAMLTIENGDSNVAIGVRAMQQSTSGNYNTVVGSRAGYGTNGKHNTFIGRNAGDTNINGIYNIAIGSSAKVGENGTNRVLLGSQAINDEDNTVMLGNTDTEKVFTFGDFDCRKNGGGIILRDDNGNVYKLIVGTDGQLSIVHITN